MYSPLDNSCPHYKEASPAQLKKNQELLAKGLRNAGEMLDRLIRSVGLDRTEDCFLTNIVHCRPPENRTPTPVEAANCQYIAENEVQIVQPRIVFAVGAFAAERFLQRKVVMKNDAGHIFPIKVGETETKLMPVYHPAYIMRKGEKEAKELKLILGDMIRDGLREIHHPKLRERGK